MLQYLTWRRTWTSDQPAHLASAWRPSTPMNVVKRRLKTDSVTFGSGEIPAAAECAESVGYVERRCGRCRDGPRGLSL